MSNNTNTNTSSSLPIGWDNRHNQMSEKDIMLGGAAATKFASATATANITNNNNAYANEDAAAMTYKNSEDVRAFYRKKIEAQEQQQQEQQQNDSTSTSTTTTSVPIGWENRQKIKQMETQQQQGVFSNSNSRHQPPPDFTAGNRHQMSMQMQKPMQGTPPTIPEQAPLTPATLSTTGNNNNTASTTTYATAEEMLVSVTTHTLNNMAQALEQNPIALTTQNRTHFAKAMQRAMNAIANCKH